MSIGNIEFIYTSEKHEKSYHTLTKKYEREIKSKPLYDETWKKLEGLINSGDEESILQAIELAYALNSRYIASIYKYLMGQTWFAEIRKFSPELYTWRYDSSFGEFWHLWDYIDSGTQAYWSGYGKRFGGFLYKGKEIYIEDVYDLVLNHYDIKDGITKVSGINSGLLKPFLIGMDGEIHRGTGETRCYVSNVVAVDTAVDVTVHLRSVDKIDVSNALNYTDVYPDEETRIQRGLLYCSIFFKSQREGVYYLKENQKPILEVEGHLSFVGENGQFIPLDETAGVELELEFPKDMVKELKASW